MSTSNKDTLINLKSIAFTNEILSKTRDGGLLWKQIDNSTYSVTICQPPKCLPNPSNKWTYYTTKNKVSDNTYIYHLEVLLDDFPFITISSMEVKYVENLFKQIEMSKTPPCNRKIRRALKFLSKIPTEPGTSVTNFAMCGGVVVDGEANMSVKYTPSESIPEVFVDGNAPVSVNYYPSEGSPETLVDGDAVMSVNYYPIEESAGVIGDGTSNP